MEIREIDKRSVEELRLVTERCMTAVLETIPEFKGSPELAKQALSNFSFEEMSQMIERDFSDPSKRIMAAVMDGTIAGQALYSIKRDENGDTYGSCFSAYVLPEYRCRGIAAQLIADALTWFEQNGAVYIVAQTHVTNTPVLSMMKRLGFETQGPYRAAWEYYVLRRDVM